MSPYTSATAEAVHSVAGGRVYADLDLTPKAPRQARRLLEDALAEWGLDHLAGTADLITSELVTNAVLHGKGPASLTIYTDPGADGGLLFIEVVDAGTDKPEKRTAGADAEDGRGLFLVDAMSEDWGVEPVEGGKRIWASISLDEAEEAER